MSFFGRHYRRNKALTTVLLSSTLNALVHLRKGFKELDLLEKDIRKARPRSERQTELLREYIVRTHTGLHLCAHIHDNLNTLLVREDRSITHAYKDVIKDLELDERERDDQIDLLRDQLTGLKERQEERQVEKRIDREERLEKEEQEQVDRLCAYEQRLRRKFQKVEHDEELAAKYRLRGGFNKELFKEFDLRKAKRIAQVMIYRDIKLDGLEEEVVVDERNLTKRHVKLAKKLEKEIEKLLKVIGYESLKNGVLMLRLKQRLEKMVPIVGEYPDCKFKRQFLRYHQYAQKALKEVMVQDKRLNMDRGHAGKRGKHRT
ncbi:MAG: hypothetical protein GXP63_05150 [DPANN group archaeon]|nr:hypothetical protein [DPANN group archaeon]